jgi:hypothetical protein
MLEIDRSQSERKFIVITSINEVNDVMRKFASLSDWQLILVGDRKGPKQVDDDRIVFLDMETQKELGFTYFYHCPENHYSRKNLGYLYAISLGAEIIAESDDDNLPYDNWGQAITFDVDELEVFSKSRFFNVYAEFCGNTQIWPRGFPLEYVLAPHNRSAHSQKCKIGVWQQLADDNPDVDAIYRLTHKFSAIRFDRQKNIALDKHVYCPFNSQNTFWSYQAFPLMYLPQSVTFRFTDILRGYIAQRIFWEKDLLLGFGGSSVCQDRNEHNLMRDFQDEIPMYVDIVSVVKLLEGIALSESLLSSLVQVYTALFEQQIVNQSELAAANAWIKDLQALGFE